MACFKLPQRNRVQSASYNLCNNRRSKQNQRCGCLKQKLYLYRGQSKHFPLEKGRTGTENQADKNPQKQRRISEYFNIHNCHPFQNSGNASIAVIAYQRQNRSHKNSHKHCHYRNNQGKCHAFHNKLQDCRIGAIRRLPSIVLIDSFSPFFYAAASSVTVTLASRFFNEFSHTLASVDRGKQITKKSRPLSRYAGA